MISMIIKINCTVVSLDTVTNTVIMQQCYKFNW